MANMDVSVVPVHGLGWADTLAITKIEAQTK